MQVGCTKKLLEYLSCEIGEVDTQLDSLFSFTANLITVNRRKCIVVTNDASGCGFMIYGVTAKDKKRARELILQGLEHMLRSEHLSEALIAHYLQDCGDVLLTKTANRSAIAKNNRFAERVLFYDLYWDDEDMFQSRLLIYINDDIVKIDGDLAFSYETLHRRLQEQYTEPLFDYTAFQLDISLQLGESVCRRRVTVPSDITFGHFHRIIQALFEWENGHLHEFILKTDKNGCPTERIIMREDEDMADFFADKCTTYNENELCLCEVFPKTKVITYVYDFGDGWEHVIQLEKTILHCHLPNPVCDESEGAAPPEDCGGPYGFEMLKEALSDRRHPDHKEMAEWYGYSEIQNTPIAQINNRLKFVARDFNQWDDDYE